MASCQRDGDGGKLRIGLQPLTISSPALTPKYVGTPADWTRPTAKARPRGDAGKPHAGIDPRVRRIPPSPANRSGGRMRLGRRRDRSGPPAVSRSQRSIARRSPSSGQGCGRSNTTPCPSTCVGRRFRLRPIRGSIRSRLPCRPVPRCPPSLNSIGTWTCHGESPWPGSDYLCFGRGSGRQAADGPPQVSEDEIHNELGRLFEYVHLRPTRLESTRNCSETAGWSCLMRQPLVVEK